MAAAADTDGDDDKGDLAFLPIDEVVEDEEADRRETEAPPGTASGVVAVDSIDVALTCSVRKGGLGTKRGRSSV